VRFLLPTPTGRAYAEAYNLTHTKEFMNDFCKDAIEAHKEVVNASEWLSDASKKRLCEKLDAIDVQAVYPEAWEDYSGLELEGLSYYEARRAIWLFDVARNTALTGTKPDARLWVAGGPTLVGSAHYDGNTNSFVIPGGSVESEVARYEAGEISLGEFMGGPAGYAVFHEIGHALDPNDIKIGPHGEVGEEVLRCLDAFAVLVIGDGADGGRVL
jgi:putative endopeptidase